MDIKELRALIQLLDDPDESIFLQVRTKIQDSGIQAIPFLETAWEETSFGAIFQERIEQIIHQIQFESLKDDLRAWKNSDHVDLLEGMQLIARYQYPDYDFDKTLQVIAQLEKDIWLELNLNLTAFEKVKIFNHILFEVHGFSANKNNYHAPQNSFINDVFETKKGNPVALAIVYLILAQRLKVPIFGINLPMHFILGFMSFNPFQQNFEWVQEDVLFYINPFSEGAVLSKPEIDMFLEKANVKANTSCYLPCDTVQILYRVLTNLHYAYEIEENSEKSSEIIELRAILKD